MRDPAARIDRRVWTSCTACPDGADCTECGGGRNCTEHWRYLLDTDGRQVFVQCPRCLHRWWHDTRFGAGSRPAGVTEVSRLWTSGPDESPGDDVAA
jgi:hypothetical protein